MAGIMRAILVKEFGKRFVIDALFHSSFVSTGDASVCKLFRDAPIPSIQPQEVLIRVHAAGINPVDTYIRSGTYARRPTLPYSPGFDGAGVIEKVGADVNKYKVRPLTSMGEESFETIGIGW